MKNKIIDEPVFMADISLEEANLISPYEYKIVCAYTSDGKVRIQRRSKRVGLPLGE